MLAGATAHVRAFPEDDGGTYLSPQVLTDVDHSTRIMRDETFAPVVGIMKVAGDDEALALMNDSDFGLTASLWTTDAERAEALGHRVETGTVFMNRADYLDPALCWTGCKLTGKGGGALRDRLSQPHPSEVVPSEKGRGMTLRADWSYPTSIRFGAGRIGELPDACAEARIQRPLLVTGRRACGAARDANRARNP